MAEIMDKIKSAFKSIASTEEKEKKETATVSTIEKDAKKNEKMSMKVLQVVFQNGI